MRFAASSWSPRSFKQVTRSVATCGPLLLLGAACEQARDPEPSPASGGAPSSGGDVNQSGSGGALGTGGETAAGGATGGEASGTGGEGPSGGASSGGAPQLDRSYAHGLVPTGIGDVELKAAWTHWKETYVETCGDDSARVKWDEPTQTVSEGIAYGMLAAAGNADQDLFDRFWQYYQDNSNENGFMHWKRAGCEGAVPEDNASNAATDADINAAMALIQAECRFDDPGYGTAADALITSIFEHETVGSSLGSGLLLLKPGDMFGGTTCLNPSYFAPAYYRVYAERASQAARKDQWLKLADDSYTLLSRFAHTSTGLVPNWVDEEGNTGEAGPSGCTYYTAAHIYGSDAIRTPWRVAVDYVWHGTPEAKTFLDKITAFVKTQGITSIGRKYELDGTAFGEIDHSILSVGAFANGAMSSDQATLDEFAAEALTLNDHNYFPDSLRLLYLLVLTGRFDTCAGAHLPL